ncbi:MAG: transposase [Nitrospirales bacterium]|nr:transposase [Nitrospira sp.]MDR4459482.1 transposase [Nitrospirales bacterium]
MTNKSVFSFSVCAHFRAAEASTIEAAARQHGVCEQSVYQWKRQLGQMNVDDVWELRHLRKENARLKKSWPNGT